jgi:dienelactone hydrolase
MTSPRLDRRTLWFAMLSLALTGCASAPPEPRPWAEVATRELQLALDSIEVQGRRVAITRSATAAAATPVVVYLPGLGQDADAGQRWAAAWAQAGYTVLTVQPLAADALAWRSALARAAEFRALGEHHYGPGLRAERLAALRQLLPALQAAQPALDWRRSALAGYETGAQTALDARADAAWRAVIAISPPAMQAPATGAPALLITSETDHDPLGLLRSPAERLQALAADGVQLAQLGAVSHAALAGTRAPDGWHAQDQHLVRAARRGPGQGGGAPGGAPGGGALAPRSGSATEAALTDLGDGLSRSRAFLDAWLRRP